MEKCVMRLLSGINKEYQDLKWSENRKGMRNSQIPVFVVCVARIPCTWKEDSSLSSNLLYFHIRHMVLYIVYTNIWCCVW